jgi:hypothetical protein
VRPIVPEGFQPTNEEIDPSAGGSPHHPGQIPAEGGGRGGGRRFSAREELSAEGGLACCVPGHGDEAQQWAAAEQR